MDIVEARRRDDNPTAGAGELIVGTGGVVIFTPFLSLLLECSDIFL